MSEVKLPTEEELAELPKPLIVAYAVAAAKRVFVYSELHFGQEDLGAVRNAIEVAEEYSKSQATTAAATAAADARAVALKADKAVQADRTADTIAVRTSATAALNAANATRAAVGILADATLDTVRAATRANNNHASRAAARAYFNQLKEIAKTSNVLNVDIPIWPNGEPEWSLELKKKVAEKRAKEKPAEYDVEKTREEEGSSKIAIDFRLSFPVDMSKGEVSDLVHNKLEEINELFDDDVQVSFQVTPADDGPGLAMSGSLMSNSGYERLRILLNELQSRVTAAVFRIHSDKESDRTIEQITFRATHNEQAEPDPDELAKKIGAFVKAMSAYHISLGGNGLVLDDLEVYTTADEPVEV